MVKMENGAGERGGAEQQHYAAVNGTNNGNNKTVSSMLNAAAVSVSMESLDSAISATNGGGSGGGGDSQSQPLEVRTLFVSGLPVDVKPRELYLLFRAYAGYEASQLKMTATGGKNGATVKANNATASTPVGFVTFVTRANAEEAIRKLEGVKFDPDQAQTIRLEFARSNTKVTKSNKQPSPPNHSSCSSLPAILPPPVPLVPHHHNAIIAAQQLVAIHQQQQLAAAMLLNQHNYHHQPADVTADGTSSQHQLLTAMAAAAADPQHHQRISLPMLGGTAVDVQQQLAAMAALNGTAAGSAGNATFTSLASMHQQQQLVQQLLQQKQNGVLLAGGTPNNQILAALAIAQAQQQNLNGSPANQWTSPPSQPPFHVPAAAGPCSTIFVGNLGQAASIHPEVVEEELKSLFGMFPGFSRIRLHAKGGAPVAFVEFSEVSQAVTAMQTLQGYVLGNQGNSGAGTGIRIEFAKSRMGDPPNSVPARKDDHRHRHHSNGGK